MSYLRIFEQQWFGLALLFGNNVVLFLEPDVFQGNGCRAFEIDSGLQKNVQIFNFVQLFFGRKWDKGKLWRGL